MTQTDTSELRQEAREFSFNKIAVIEGERLSDEDVLELLIRRFGSDHMVWLELYCNKHVRNVPGLQKMVFGRFIALANEPRPG